VLPVGAPGPACYSWEERGRPGPDRAGRRSLDLSAGDIFLLLEPSRCERRVWLEARAGELAPPGPFEQMLMKLGREHEQRHLEEYAEVLDLSRVPVQERADETRRALEEGERCLYHPRFEGSVELAGETCRLVGEPDFMVPEEGGWVIRDTKLARLPEESSHPEIYLQMDLYGWLLELETGAPPLRMEVVGGAGDVLPAAYRGGEGARELLEQVIRLRRQDEEPWSPLGWTKCSACAFKEHCVPRGWERRELGLVPGIDLSLARVLHERGLETCTDLLVGLDEDELAATVRPHGKRMVRVGDRADEIRQQAASIASGRPLLRTAPRIPESDAWVMFDLEGLPAYGGGRDGIFLWGLQVYLDDGTAAEYQGVMAGFEEGDDEAAWEEFLARSRAVFERHGPIPFVHWHHYERVWIENYLRRFGDRDGLGAEVLRRLYDLLPVTRKAMVLPVPSYSLKVLEKLVGYERQLKGAAGDWAVARYLEAGEVEDEGERREILGELLTYNREDLEATWAVFDWVRRQLDLLTGSDTKGP
jgi:predicted RecB family nuclease